MVGGEDFGGATEDGRQGMPVDKILGHTLDEHPESLIARLLREYLQRTLDGNAGTKEASKGTKKERSLLN